MILKKEDLSEKYGISAYAWKYKKQDVLDHLRDFMDITEIHTSSGRYVYEVSSPLPQSIPPLPRHSNSNQKKLDYENYTLAALGSTFQFNSKTKIAREAIQDFGYKKYGHSSERNIRQRYIKEPFNKYGEKQPNSEAWVWYSTYEPLTTEELTRWKVIMQEEHISEEEQANAFRKFACDIDISEEISYYKKAMKRFKEEYQDIPIKIRKWRKHI